MKVHKFGYKDSAASGASSIAQLGREIRRSYQLHSTIKHAAAGDLVQIAGGEYSFGGNTYADVGIQGSGSANTKLTTEPVTFQGNSALIGCTVGYLRYKKSFRAISVEGAGSHLQLQDVIVGPLSGDPGSAAIGKTASALADRKGIPEVRVGPGATLVVDNSSIGSMVVDGGALYYTATAKIGDLKCLNNGIASPVAPQSDASVPVQPRHGRVPSPEPGDQIPQRQAAQPSAPPQLAAPAGSASGKQDRAWLDSVRANADSLLAGLKKSTGKGAAKPNSSRGAVDLAAIGPRTGFRPTITSGHVLPWPSASGHDWEGLIAPGLRPGCTVVLEEGAYWIPSQYFVDMTISGADPWKTVVHLTGGPLGPAAGRSLTLMNLTLRPAIGKPALKVTDGRALNLSNVVVDHFRDTDETMENPIPLIVLRSGDTTLSQCEIRADRHSVTGSIEVADSGRLHMSRTSAGWVGGVRGHVELSDCALHGVSVESGSTVYAAGSLILTESSVHELPSVGVDKGGRFTAGRIISARPLTKLLSGNGAEIRVEQLDLPASGRAIVECNDGGTAEVGGDQSRIAREGSRGTEIGTIEELLAEVDSMVGLEPVKAWVHGLARRVQFDQEEGESVDNSNYHMVFYGSPGTGKTTVARLIGKLLFRLGVLPTTNYSEVDRSKVVSKWQAETEENTRALIDKSMGGVLFVDEAYQLVREKSGTTDVGQEAIDTLLTALENQRGEFVAIFAGYTEPMKDFLDANPGLRSRLRDRNRIDFPDYTPHEVGRITADILITSKWRIHEQPMIDAVARKYASLPEDEKGNGRSARNFAESIIEVQKEFAVEHDVPRQHRREIRPEVVQRVLGV